MSTGAETSLEAAIDRVIEAAPADPRGALFLCAYLSKRAQLHDEPARSQLLGRLAVLAVGADADAIAAAQRYADLRATLSDLDARIADVPARPVRADLDVLAEKLHRLERVGAALPVALVVGLILAVLGLAIGGTFGFVLSLPGILGAFLYRPARFVTRGLAADAASAIARSAELDALDEMVRAAAADRDRILSSVAGEWLAEIEARPALAFAELDPRTTTAYR